MHFKLQMRFMVTDSMSVDGITRDLIGKAVSLKQLKSQMSLSMLAIFLHLKLIDVHFQVWFGLEQTPILLLSIIYMQSSQVSMRTSSMDVWQSNVFSRIASSKVATLM